MDFWNNDNIPIISKNWHVDLEKMHEYDALKKMATSNEVFKNKMHWTFFIGKINKILKFILHCQILIIHFSFKIYVFTWIFYQVYA
jgi:hypothetical protein